eukprot:TRINITY_DN53994_c0_g1_i1.p1 TRINITY_DN53994_c0_g1~~TRINITY_DN53994_c0_g1_i1.p1  ORF type:complete len:452 (+),score=61.01 TRINITY_DN53994_c0_g1_i1:24-1358(+)
MPMLELVELLQSFLQGNETLAGLMEAIITSPVETFATLDCSVQNHRRIWFLFELCLGAHLDNIADFTADTDTPLLFPAGMFWDGGGTAPTESLRHGLRINVPSCSRMLVIVRSDVAEEFAAIEPLFRKSNSPFPADLEQRATNYMFTTETKFSYAIEKARTSVKSLASLFQLLHEVQVQGKLRARHLQRAAHALSPYADAGWRTIQNFIGGGLGGTIHLVPPPPLDVPWLMDAVFELYDKYPLTVVFATVLSFLVVIIHPFEDGNGRTSRWLLHVLLSQLGINIPVSFAFYSDLKSYYGAIHRVWFQVQAALVEHIVETADGGIEITVPAAGARFACMDLTPVVQYTMAALHQANNFFQREQQFLQELDAAMEVCATKGKETSRPGFEGLVVLYLVHRSDFVTKIKPNSREEALYSAWTDEDYDDFISILDPLAARWKPVHCTM